METPASENLDEIIRLHSFGERRYRLLLDQSRLVFNQIEVKLASISHCKFGGQIRQLGMFPVGRRYEVSVKTPEAEIRLVFSSFLGVRDKYLSDLYEKLANGIWLKIGDRLVQEAIHKIKAGQAWVVGPCSVSAKGITLAPGSAGNALPLILWPDLHYEKKYNRLVINSKSKRQWWLNLHFLEYWNVEVLMNLLDWLYEENGLAELPDY